MKKLLMLMLAFWFAALGLLAPASAEETPAAAPVAVVAPAASLAEAAAAPSPAAAPAAVAVMVAPAAVPAPSANKGDTAWLFVATAFVILMSIPGLALFYGGLVRSKNMLSVLMQVFVVFSLISVLWVVYGYSVAFTEGNAFFGGFDKLLLKG